MAFFQQKFIKKNWPWSIKQKLEFVKLLKGLLKNGFPLQETLPFIRLVMPKITQRLVNLEQGFQRGDPLSRGLKACGFTEYEETILYFAEFHGDFIGAFQLIEDRLTQRRERQKRLLRLLGYPLILAFFLLFILMAIRTVILPELATGESKYQQSFGLMVISNGPEMLGIGLLIFLGIVWLCYLLSRRMRPVNRLILLSKVPIISHFLQKVMTAFFSHQLGKLLLSGLEMQEIMTLMGTEDGSGLAKGISERVVTYYQRGENLSQALGSLPFLRPEFEQIVVRGEVQGELGGELVIYSAILWEDLDDQINRVFLWLQPVVFSVIALVILAVYGALLLPIYQEMEGIV